MLAMPQAVEAQQRGEVLEYRVFGEADSHTVNAIAAMIDAYRSAWSSQDTMAFVALHASDAEWINAYARMFRDSASFEAFIGQRLFPAFEPAVSRQEAENMRTVSIRYLGDDAAVVHLYTEGQRGAARNTGEAMRRTHIHLVMQRQSSAWQIVHTAIMDAR